MNQASTTRSLNVCFQWHLIVDHRIIGREKQFSSPTLTLPSTWLHVIIIVFQRLSVSCATIDNIQRVITQVQDNLKEFPELLPAMAKSLEALCAVPKTILWRWQCEIVNTFSKNFKIDYFHYFWDLPCIWPPQLSNIY